MQDAPSNRRPHILLAAAVTSVAAGALLLRLVPPQTSSLYPICPFHQYTGLLCPGCGATRALAALAAGHPALAWRLNPLVIATFALTAIFALTAYIRALQGKRICSHIPSPAIAAAVLATLAFSVIRNLP